MNIYVIKHIDNINLSLAIHCLFSFKRKRCKATSDNFCENQGAIMLHKKNKEKTTLIFRIFCLIKRLQ